MKRKVLLILSSYIILMIIVSVLIVIFKEDSRRDDMKIQIITTLYPEYDFVSKIGGDKVEVKCLLGPGVEAHTYEPSVKDMKNISDSDIFIYTCEAMEPWSKVIINSIDSDCKVIDSSENIELIKLEEFEDKYNVLKEEHENHSEEVYEFDGHIWLNPQNAIIMIDNICNGLVEIDPNNKEYYQKNANKYKNEIDKLDKKIENSIKENQITTLVFGGEFAYAYFCDRYNLNIISAYTACGEGAEPSVSKIKDIIDYINLNNISKVYYEELSEGTDRKSVV